MWVQLDTPTDRQARGILERIEGRAKFLVDENLGQEVARIMSDLGYNTKFAPDVGLGGHSDEEVFALAWSDSRIILTHDRDFLDDRNFPFNRNPGVIVLPGAHGSDKGLQAALSQVIVIIGNYRNLFPNSKIEITEDNTWTVKYVDKGEGRFRQRRLRFEQGRVWEWE